MFIIEWLQEQREWKEKEKFNKWYEEKKREERWKEFKMECIRKGMDLPPTPPKDDYL